MKRLEFESESEKDKYVASLYIARSNGKTIQEPAVIGAWIDLGNHAILSSYHRVKPEPKTIKEAAEQYYRNSEVLGYISFFIAGAKYQKENPEAAEK